MMVVHRPGEAHFCATEHAVGLWLDQGAAEAGLLQSMNCTLNLILHPQMKFK